MKQKVPYLKLALGLFLMLFLVASGSKVYMLLFSKLAEKGFSMSFLSFGALLTTLAVFLSGLALDWVLRKIGIRRTMVLGGVLMAAAYVLLAWAPNAAVLILAVLLMGAATTFSGYTPVSILMQKWFASGYGLAMSAVFTGMTFGASFYAFLYGKLIGTLGYFGTMTALAILPLVLPFLINWLLIRENPADSGVEPYRSAKPEGQEKTQKRLNLSPTQAKKTGLFWYILALTFFLGGVVATAQGFIPAFLEGKQFTTEQASTVYSVMMLLGAPATLLGGYLADRFSPRSFLLVAALSFLGGMGILLTAGSSYGLLFVMAVLMGMAFPSGSLTPSLLMNENFGVEAYKGLLGIVQATSFVSIGVMFMAAGSVRDATGSYDGIFLALFAIGAVCTIAVLLYPLVRRHALRRHGAAT